MITRRERLKAKLDRREEWALKRHNKASKLRAVDEHLRGDLAFATQPGRISARARMIARTDKAREHSAMASHHASKAEGLSKHLDRTIFTDDDDAVEKLLAKIATLEAKRDEMKHRNKEWRKAGKGKAHEGWELSNLGARIRSNRERVTEVKRRQSLAAEVEATESGVLVKEHGGGYVSITFEEKPDREIRQGLGAAGFRFGGGGWYGRWDDLGDELKNEITCTAPEAE
jgi:hypothetical protein